MRILETDRLLIRGLNPSDAPFILELLNEPGWLKYIGDKGVRTLEDAEKYILTGPMDMYEQLGFGLCAVDLKETGEPIGICGLIKRDTLENVDIGFAFLESFWGKGYAVESAQAVMEFAKGLGLDRVVAITTTDNELSARLLGKLGFEFEKNTETVANGETLKLFGWNRDGNY